MSFKPRYRQLTIDRFRSSLERLDKSKYILTLIDLAAGEFRYRLDCLRKDQRRVLDATMKMYFQQELMFRTGEHSCKDRIVSIFQFCVRPIVRGKASANVEFGAKIGGSAVDGYNFIDHHSWDAYNEGADLQLQIDKYKERFGSIPATILAGKRVYQANDIRAMLSETAECRIGMCYFAKNVMNFFRGLCHTLYVLLRFLTLVAIVGTGLRPAWQVEAN